MLKLKNKSRLTQGAVITTMGVLGALAGKALHTTVAGTSASTPSLTELTSCITFAEDYDHGGWELFQSNVCEASYLWPSLAENIRLMMDELGVTGSDIKGEKTVTGTLGGKSASIALSKPTDTAKFPYDHKAVVTIDGKTKAVAYWSGADDLTHKGFVIYGPASTGTFQDIVDSSTMSFGGYINWDKTGDRQEIQVLAGKWFSSRSYADPDLTLSTGDRQTLAQYVKFTKEQSTETVEDLQVIRVRDGLDTAKGTNRCYRQRMFGRLTAKGSTTDGSVVTFNTPGASPDAITSTDVDGTNGSGTDTSSLSQSEEFKDNIRFADGTNLSAGAHTFASSYTPLTGAAVAGPGDFDMTCADVTTGKASLFADATDTVEFDSAPADVFPNPTSAFVP